MRRSILNNESNLSYLGMNCEEFCDVVVKTNIGGSVLTVILFLLRVFAVIKWSYILVFVPVLLPSAIILIAFVFVSKRYAIAIAEHMSESMKDK